MERRPTRLLDVACGTGNLAMRFAERGYEVTGIDLSRGMLREASKKARRKAISTRLVRASMVSFDLDREFDAAYCVNAFGHLIRNSEVVSHFRSVSRHLRPDGIYVFEFPRRTGIPEEEQQWTYTVRPLKTLDLSEYHQSRRGIVNWRSHWFVIS